MFDKGDSDLPQLLFFLSAPKVSWGRPASQTRTMLGSGHRPGDSLVPRYRLAQGCPSLPLGSHVTQPHHLAMLSLWTLPLCSSSNHLHPQIQIKVRCSSHRSLQPLSSLQGWRRPLCSHYPKIGSPTKMPSPSKDHIFSPNSQTKYRRRALHASSPLGRNSPCTGVW